MSEASVDIVVVDRPQCGSEQAEVMIFPQFIATDKNPSFNDGIVNLTGVCAATRPIISRVANTDDAVGVVY